MTRDTDRAVDLAACNLHYVYISRVTMTIDTTTMYILNSTNSINYVYVYCMIALVLCNGMLLLADTQTRLSECIND